MQRNNNIEIMSVWFPMKNKMSHPRGKVGLQRLVPPKDPNFINFH